METLLNQLSVVSFLDVSASSSGANSHNIFISPLWILAITESYYRAYHR